MNLMAAKDKLRTAFKDSQIQPTRIRADEFDEK
jgi:hypothetical protein